MSYLHRLGQDSEVRWRQVVDAAPVVLMEHHLLLTQRRQLQAPVRLPALPRTACRGRVVAHQGLDLLS